MKTKKDKVEIISVTKESKNIITFKAKYAGRIITDRCKISGIKNQIKNNHIMADVYSAVINSLEGKNGQASTN